MQTTSLEAYASVKPRIGSDERRILDYLRTLPDRVVGAVTMHYEPDGRTCEELESALGLPHTSCSARLTGLRKRGLICDSGQRRKTRSGREAIVWRAYRGPIPDVVMDS